jgi:hypothetical protein
MLTGKKVNLITIATPASNHGEREVYENGRVYNNPRWYENPSNPIFNNSLGIHYQLWIKNDLTAGVGSKTLEGSDLTFKSSRTWNIQMDHYCSSVYTYLWDNRHGFPYYLDCIKNYIPSLNVPRQY